MPKRSPTKSGKPRVSVEKLPTKTKKLSKKDAKKVKGGILIGLLLPVKAPTPTSGQQFTNTVLDDQAIKK